MHLHTLHTHVIFNLPELELLLFPHLHWEQPCHAHPKFEWSLVFSQQILKNIRLHRFAHGILSAWHGNRFQLLLWIFNWLPTWKTHWTDESWSGALPTWISIILKIWPQSFWFSPHTAIQSCFPCDNVGLRGSHSHCCKSGRKGERCPNKSKSPWKEITSWANPRVHARTLLYLISKPKHDKISY